MALQARVHHAAPLVVAAEVFALFADGLADPFLELGLGQVVVVDPLLVAGVVGRVDIDALDLAGVGREQGFERQQVVPLDDQIAVQRRRLALVEHRELRVELEGVVRDRVVVGLDGRLAFEVQGGHGVASRGRGRRVSTIGYRLAPS